MSLVGRHVKFRPECVVLEHRDWVYVIEHVYDTNGRVMVALSNGGDLHDGVLLTNLIDVPELNRLGHPFGALHTFGSTKVERMRVEEAARMAEAESVEGLLERMSMAEARLKFGFKDLAPAESRTVETPKTSITKEMPKSEVHTVRLSPKTETPKTDEDPYRPTSFEQEAYPISTGCRIVAAIINTPQGRAAIHKIAQEVTGFGKDAAYVNLFRYMTYAEENRAVDAAIVALEDAADANSRAGK